MAEWKGGGGGVGRDGGAGAESFSEGCVGRVIYRDYIVHSDSEQNYFLYWALLAWSGYTTLSSGSIQGDNSAKKTGWGWGRLGGGGGGD